MATYQRLGSDPAEVSFVFGPFRLFPMQRLLTESGKPVRLGSRALDILMTLLERPGEVVSKEELMARVWPKTFVAPANLSVHISALRNALGDECGRNRYLLNVSGRGYQFVAPVTFKKHPPSDALAAAPPREQNLPTRITEPTAHADLVGGLAQQIQRGRLLAIVGEDGIGEPTAARTVLERLIGADGNSLWLVDLSLPGKS